MGSGTLQAPGDISAESVALIIDFGEPFGAQLSQDRLARALPKLYCKAIALTIRYTRMARVLIRCGQNHMLIFVLTVCAGREG